MSSVVVNVDINVNILKVKQKYLINIDNVYYVYCKHKCAIKVNVV